MIPLGVLASAHVPAAGGGGTLAVSYVGEVSSSADLTTYTFAGTDIGTASADRTLIIAAMGRGSAALTSMSVTVGGVAATEDAIALSSVQTGCGLWRIAYPTGTTADVAVTFSATRWGAAAHIYAITGAPVSVADSDSVTPAASTTLGPVAVSAAAGGVIVAASLYKQSGTPSAAWTGVTEDFDALYGGFVGTGGHDTTATAANVDVSVAVDTSYAPCLTAVAYAPA